MLGPVTWRTGPGNVERASRPTPSPALVPLLILAGFFVATSLLAGTTCASCPAGQWCNTSGKTPACEDCTTGTYNPVANGVCQACPPGTFSDIPGATTCTPCLAGTASGDAGRDSACDPCGGGNYANEGWQECQPCSAGTFSFGEAPTGCLPCDAGNWSPTGSDQCFECIRGTYQPLDAQAHCESCPPGYTTVDSAATDCIPCDPGTYAFGLAAAACSACTANHVSDEGMPTCFELGTCIPFGVEVFVDGFESGDTSIWSP